ncbi:MAG: LacI family DNA-binding transcriptional regulator, partial [Bacteroidetes bacterium]|nr:LacI family DNA-binding transcriptional regulator [Bacteroidota bacterium]
MKTDTRKAGSERDARRATIKDIADQAGVSVGTVSAVINQKASVSNDTRARVLSVIDELNYRPNAAARRRLQRTSQKSIGFVIKEMQNPYFADVIIGVQEVAHARGYNVIVVSSERQSELEHELTELLVAKDVDGLVINPLLDDSADIAHLFELKRRKIPLILLESIRGLSASMVDVNNVQASKHAVEWLIDHGHKRIVHFAGPMYSMHSDERIEGVRRAFSAQQLALTERDVVHAGARLEDG